MHPQSTCMFGAKILKYQNNSDEIFIFTTEKKIYVYCMGKYSLCMHVNGKSFQNKLSCGDRTTNTDARIKDQGNMT